MISPSTCIHFVVNAAQWSILEFDNTVVLWNWHDWQRHDKEITFHFIFKITLMLLSAIDNHTHFDVNADQWFWSILRIKDTHIPADFRKRKYCTDDSRAISQIPQCTCPTSHNTQVHCGVCEIHYDDVRMGAIASQITSLTIVYSIVHSDADQRKHQRSASLAFVWGIHRGPCCGMWDRCIVGFVRLLCCHQCSTFVFWSQLVYVYPTSTTGDRWIPRPRWIPRTNGQ